MLIAHVDLLWKRFEFFFFFGVKKPTSKKCNRAIYVLVRECMAMMYMCNVVVLCETREYLSTTDDF